MIHFDGVSLTVNRNLILRNISASFEAGSFNYILGMSGAGKSTLLRSIYADVIPSAGSINVLEKKIEQLKFNEIPYLRRQMGIIFQDFKLLPERTIYQNLEFVLKAIGWENDEIVHQRIIEVLYTVGLKDLRDRLPHELSGGEQQRAGVARAILNSPKLIIADEPTGNLDPKTARQIFKLVHDQHVQNDATVLMATHAYNLMQEFPGNIFYLEERGAKFLTTDQFEKKLDQLRMESF